MNKRLTMVVHAHYPVGEPRVEREARAAVEAGYEVEVVCLRGRGEPARETVDGISIRRLPIAHERGGGLKRMLVEYAGFTLLAGLQLALRRRRADVVHVHAPPDFLVATALGPRLRGASVVLDIHDLSPHMYMARFAPGARTRLLTRALTAVERVSCALAERVITVHEPYARELAADGVARKKIAVVMNAADEAVVERAAARAVGARNGHPFTAAYHGTITSWYGVDLLVDALGRLDARIPDSEALVLGGGDAVDDVRDLAAQAGIADRVEVPGEYLPLEETLTRVASVADCGVIPNRPTTLNRFALSSKLFEYVALGIPAVVARLETLAAHFDDDHVTFFEPGDPASLAEAIAWVAEHPAEARAKAERARDRAAEYSWRRNRERYLELLRGLRACAA
jgi:glycosyltransferase involved in cell wall biosynthesis